MTHSMTAFASLTGNLGSVSWHWEMRGVNARGLDLRLRLPDSIDGLEAKLRKALAQALSRGNITVNLRITHEEAGSGVSVDEGHLDGILQALDLVQERAFAMGVTLGQPTAADVLAQRGVLVAAKQDIDDGTVAAALTADITPLIEAFLAMRAAEGAALHAVVSDHLDQISDLTKAAAKAAADRVPQQRENLSVAMHRILDDAVDMDEGRLMQELALIAVKSDITEEIDRLGAHVAAARAFLTADGPVGRKLDFLAQEFNREANTLCAKSQAAPLTAIGLDLKAAIDQMREQIQNVE